MSGTKAGGPNEEFRPAWYARGGHLQTAIGYFRDEAGPGPPATVHEVPLPDGDRMALHLSLPAAPGAAVVALLVHGLAGCHDSPYMRRIAAKLLAAGVPTARLDLRTCGAGLPWARRPYHAGQSNDLRAALAALATLLPGAPVRLIGFSLGGSVALKLAGEPPPPPNLASVLAVCAPIDLELGVRRLAETALLRMYDRYFARELRGHIGRWQAACPDAPRVALPRRLRTILEIDERLTAPFGGFASASDYYTQSSPAAFLPRIAVPTEILSAADDPLVPPEPLRRAGVSAFVRRRELPSGGHLGFVSATRPWRWLDRQTLAHVLRAPTARAVAQ